MPQGKPKKAQLIGNRGGEWYVRQELSAAYDRFTLHHHDGYEFFLHIRNGRFYQMDQRIIPLQPYQLIVVPPRQIHGLVRTAPLQDYERLTVRIQPEVLEQLGYGGTSAREIIDQYCAQPPQQVIVPPQEYLRLRILASAIMPYEDVRTPLEHMEALGYLSAMLSRFCQALMTVRQQEQQPRLTVPIMQDVYNCILERFTEDCSLETLAERFSMSKYHLSHRFSETFGVSLHQFVVACRIAYAQHLIRQGEPLIAVSEQCGFNDYSSFVRAFERSTGMSPRAWRVQQLQLRSAAAQTSPQIVIPPVRHVTM